MQSHCACVLLNSIAYVSELSGQINYSQNKQINLLGMSLPLLVSCFFQLKMCFVKIHYSSIHAAVAPHNFASLIEMRFK